MGKKKGEIRRWGTTNKAAGSEGRSEWVGGWVSRSREIINCAIGECDSSYAETTPSQREGGWVD